jgi:glycosyltransferase involved in cell wall biosynthesis
MKNSLLITIVTPSFNQVDFIGEALESVKLQSYSNYEHIVIDGMSTDGTVDLLRSITTNKNRTKIFWITEQDSGQSEALNKGFQRANGDIIGWLNSDDRYQAGCFEHIAKAFEENPEVDILYGDYRLINESGEAIRIRREIEFSKFVLHYHRVLYIPTTSTFFRRRIFDEKNWLREDLQYVMDLDFFIRLASKGYRFKHISEILSDFRLQPESKSCKSADRMRQEHQQVIFALAPIVRDLKSAHFRAIVLQALRLVACIKRYSEKMFKGYYRKQPHLLPSGAIEI